MNRYAAAALTALTFSSCTPAPLKVPRNVTFGARSTLPNARVAAPEAPPRILAAWFSGNTVRRGSVWSGRIVTTTNVASVEVRTNLFSIDVPRKAFGHFAFTLNVFDVPPIFVRAYRLRIIARNAAGAAAEEDAPFRIR